MSDNTLTVLEDNLKKHLASYLPAHCIADAYEYAVFPPGKLFRPQLVHAIACDFDNSTKIKTWSAQLDQAYLASLVEIHHAYTLVHDDLPAMDNDLMRRGKASTHAKFGEWQALLVGDGLLNISYQLLKNISPNKVSTLLALIGHCLGPKGLIHGQVLDLNEEMRQDFKTLLRTHELKTGRLIQVAIVGSYLLLPKASISYRTSIDLAKLGYSMGIVFQLLDDLTELVDEQLNKHEAVIGPWFNFTKESYSELILRIEIIKKIQEKYQLNNFKKVVDRYYLKTYQKMYSGQHNILEHLKEKDISEGQINLVMSLLKV